MALEAVQATSYLAVSNFESPLYSQGEVATLNAAVSWSAIASISLKVQALVLADTCID